MRIQTSGLGLVLAIALAVATAACGGDDGLDAVCGNGRCSDGETATSCPDDCGCGNGVVNPGETCDGADFDGATCVSETGLGGRLACTAGCAIDTSACTEPVCGNGTAEAGETCDGDDLAGGACTDVGYSGGTLGCTAACAYDVGGCCTDICTEGDAECVGDTLRACAVGPSGCAEWVLTDCAVTNDVCVGAGAAAACECVDRCPAVDTSRCEGATIERCELQTDGCLDWTQLDDCAADAEVCAVGPAGPVCAIDADADVCDEPFPLAAGENLIAWTASTADYLTSVPSCSTSTMAGPDLVLAYAAPDDGFLAFGMLKEPGARQVIVVSDAACGTLAPELECSVDTTEPLLVGELAMHAGQTYYFYVRDTTTGTQPLANPLVFQLEPTACDDLVVPVLGLSPANGTSVPDQTPILTASLGYPVDPAHGVITVTGDAGTTLAYDLATGPAEVSLIDGGKTLVIDPGIVLPSGEQITIGWTGLVDSTCGTAIPVPPWTFEIVGPPCAPGVDGMVGTTMTRVATGQATFTEQFVAADQSASGYVYVGGLSNLYRTPKAGGATQDVEALATLAAAQLGYDMVVVGDEIYMLESVTTGTTNILWRISTTGGATWQVQNYATFPATPNDDMRGIAAYGGRLYLITEELTLGTEIWSVAVGAATPPGPAVLETTVAGQAGCSGIALDDSNYYLACSTGDHVIRIDRTTLAVTDLTTEIDLNTTKNTVHAHDFDADGHADALYVQAWDEEVNYVCDPDGLGPFFVDILANFGTGTSNYGLGFEPTATGGPALWMFDDDTREFVKIQ